MQVAPAKGAEEICYSCGGVASILSLAGCPVPVPGTTSQAGSAQLPSQATSQPPPAGSMVLGFGQYEQARRTLADAKRRVGLDLLAKDGAIPAPVLAAVRCGML